MINALKKIDSWNNSYLKLQKPETKEQRNKTNYTAKIFLKFETFRNNWAPAKRIRRGQYSLLGFSNLTYIFPHDSVKPKIYYL